MMKKPSFIAEQRRLQGAWFERNVESHRGFEGALYRLPPDTWSLNLAPGLRETADLLFAGEPPIQWHRHAGHGLSSQACCVNFLLPFAEQPELLRRWVEHVTRDRVKQMLPIEPNRSGRSWFVTFEWIGETDYLNEEKGKLRRKRGANATAADAAVLFRDGEDRTQLLLIEWKYTERYGQPLDEGGNATRRERYQDIFRQPNGPIRENADVSLEDFFYEPFYQLLRQQMLAWHTQHKDHGINRARVLHLSPRGNRALHAVTSPNLATNGGDAFEVFHSLLADRTDFIPMWIEDAFAPLADWPEADWYAGLRQRYSALFSAGEGFG
jgi:hypothetical protein